MVVEWFQRKLDRHNISRAFAGLKRRFMPMRKAAAAHPTQDVIDGVSATCPFHATNVIAGKPGEWQVRGYADVRLAFTDDINFTTQGVFDADDPVQAILTADNPKHDKNAGLFRRELHRILEEIKPGIREQVEAWALDLPVGVDFDLRTQYCNRIPVWVMTELFGFSQEALERIRTEAGEDPFSESYQERFIDILSDEIDKEPDMTCRLLDTARIAVSREVMSLEEARAIMRLLWIGGNDTTAVAITWIIYELLQHQDLWDDLEKSVHLRHRFIEECLRLHPPTSVLTLTAKKEVTLGGCPVESGALVKLDIYQANRDPSVYEFPDNISLTGNRTRHLTFGDGMHQCIGMGLSRLEALIALESILPVLPRIEFRNMDKFRMWAPVTPIELNIISHLTLFIRPV